MEEQSISIEDILHKTANYEQFISEKKQQFSNQDPKRNQHDCILKRKSLKVRND